MPPRVVSLLSSGTEMVCALGLKDALVGRSHECDYPPGIETLPICTEPRFAVDGTSIEIDQRIKALLHEALSPYHVHAGAIRELKPDIIVTQTQCEVCAVSISDVHEALKQTAGLNPEIVSLRAESLDGIWADIANLAEAVSVEREGNDLIARLRERMQTTSDTALAQSERPTICCIEWIEPLMAAGNWVPELVEMAGGINTHGEAGKHSPWMEWESLVATDPDAIAIFPCGYDIAQTRKNLHYLTDRPEWRELKAVRTGRVHLADGNQYFNRPGPRMAESLDILAAMLHPEMLTHAQRTGFVALD